MDHAWYGGPLIAQARGLTEGDRLDLLVTHPFFMEGI